MRGRLRTAVLPDAKRRTLAELSDDLELRTGDAAAKSSAFWTMLVLSATIASCGVLADSTATVIGAMIIAPLATPIMGIALAALKRQSNGSLRFVLLGSLTVVLIGAAFSAVLPDSYDLLANSQVQGRVRPTLLDLIAALATGLAGAVALARRDVAAVLPGVAIAVSLVPPLATVGICLELGRVDDAAGALLLFLTNFAAIVVVACLVFVLSGAAPSREMLRERHRLRNGFILAVGALVVISVPLALNTVGVVQTTVRETASAPLVRAWLGARDLEVTGWTVDGNRVEVRLQGMESPPDGATLARDLAKVFGSSVALDIEYVPVIRDADTGTP